MLKTTNHADYILISITIILLVLGILILSSVSAFIAQKKTGNSFYFLNHQILFGLIPGLILAIFFFKIPLDFLKKWSSFLLLINLFFLALVFLPNIGHTFGGANRWISLGPVSFQPSEFLKISFIIYLAGWLSSRLEKTTKLKKEWNQTFIVFLIVIGLIGLFLVLQPDISTLGIIVLTACLMYFSAGTPFWHISLMISFLGAVFFFLIKIAPYRLARILVFFKPETDPLGMGYQVKQALIAIGSAGFFGLGLGMSIQKFGFLPKPMSDTIFAVFSEENGFLGGIILIILFLIFFWRGVRISKGAEDNFSQLTA